MVEVKKIAHLVGHSGAVYSLSSGISQNKVLSGSGDMMLAQWDVEKCAVDTFSVKMPSIVYSSAYHEPTQTLFIGTAAGSLHVVNMKEKRELHNFKMNYGGLFTLLLSEKYNTLFVSTAKGVIAAFDLNTYALKFEIKLSALKLRSIDINEEIGMLYVSDGTGQVHVVSIINAKTEHSFLAHTQSCNVVRIHPDKKRILTGGKDAHLNVFDLRSFDKLKSIPAHNFALYDIRFMQDTPYFATASRDKTIKIWDADSCEFLLRINKEHYDAHTHSVNTLHWNTELKRLVSAGDDRALMVWQF